MAKMTDVPDVQAYSSGVKKVLILGKDGRNMAGASNPLPVDASVSVDSMTINAEMKVDSGHDLYEATNVTRSSNWKITFDSISGLDLGKLQSIENKTSGVIYITKGATVTATSITLLSSVQPAGTSPIIAGDIVEVIYRGESRLTNRQQKSSIISELIKEQYDDNLLTDSFVYTTHFNETMKVNAVTMKFSAPITQEITIEVIDTLAPDFSVILRKDDFTTPISSYVWQPDSELIISSTNKIKVTCTNKGAPDINVFLTIIGEKR